MVHRRRLRIAWGIRYGPGGLESRDDVDLAVGRLFDRTRPEVSLAQRKHGLDQMFRSITDYEGMPMAARSLECPGLDRPSHRAHPVVQCVLRFSGCVPWADSLPRRGAGSRVRHGVVNGLWAKEKFPIPMGGNEDKLSDDELK